VNRGIEQRGGRELQRVRSVTVLRADIAHAAAEAEALERAALQGLVEPQTRHVVRDVRGSIARVSLKRCSRS
jgi:class 3 adenylate cyclase